MWGCYKDAKLRATKTNVCRSERMQKSNENRNEKDKKKVKEQSTLVVACKNHHLTERIKSKAPTVPCYVSCQYNFSRRLQVQGSKSQFILLWVGTGGDEAAIARVRSPSPPFAISATPRHACVKLQVRVLFFLPITSKLSLSPVSIGGVFMAPSDHWNGTLGRHKIGVNRLLGPNEAWVGNTASNPNTLLAPLAYLGVRQGTT